MMKKYQIRPGVFIQQPVSLKPMSDDELVEYLDAEVKEYMDIWRASFYGKVKRVQELVAQEPKKVNRADAKTGLTPLCLAARGAQTDVVRVLLDSAKIKVNRAGHGGRTALHWACSVGSQEIVKMLLDAGADVNAADEAGNSPLHECARAGRMRLLNLLIERGAKVDSSNNAGSTVLMTAIVGNRGPVLHELIKHRVNLDSQDDDGNTALHFATQLGYGKLVKALVAFGASQKIKNADGKLARDYETKPPARHQ
eukprot:TRINITY_DN66392_c9_g3_i1.p1 TRINITY_DN66392_c9_g3~~TRINITY_DN66392_c9_g3_i1.p1  ORF type:complete len:254 (+),score=131.64 TRINITY_DN66392_c9_g3_i1:176-937(+)